MLQLETKTNSLDYILGKQLFKLYEKQIVCSSKIIRDIFTLDNISSGFASLRYLGKIINDYTTKIKSLKLPFYQNLMNPCFLLVIYCEIKKNRIGETRNAYLGVVSLDFLVFLASGFSHKKYSPKPIRRIFIREVSGKMKSFGVASLIDNIVQQVLKFVLTLRFELVFSDFSYGCRPKHNSHFALKYIHNYWVNIKWFIDCSLARECFDAFSFSVFLSVFNCYIDDYWTSIIINKILKVGYIYFGNLCNSLLEFKAGLAQSLNISSFLCNIFLHELDIQLELCLNTSLILISKEVFKYFRMHKKFFQYIRYLDHFILGVDGDKKRAYTALIFVAMILGSLGMKLSIEKSSVKNSMKGIVFMGYHIYNRCLCNIKWEKKNSLKVCGCTLHLKIPFQNLFQCFVKWGFFQRVNNRKSFKFVGRRQDKWLFVKNAYEIIIRFNSIIRRVEHYYSGATKKNALVKFWHLLKRSAGLTLAHKFNKKNVSWAFHKFGRNLTVINPKNGKGIYFWKLREGVYKFGSGDLSDLLFIWHNISIPIMLNKIRSVEKLDCVIPNCTGKANRWYYIKHRKCLKSFKYKKVILSYFAKQISLCASHYKLIHVGLYDGYSFRLFPGYTFYNFD